MGIATGLSRWARGNFDPPVERCRPLPPLAYRLLIIIWFGINELPAIRVGLRSAIGFGWTTLVAANVGPSRMVMNAATFLRTDIVSMGIIVIGVVA